MYTQRWWKWLRRDELWLSGTLNLCVISLFYASVYSTCFLNCMLITKLGSFDETACIYCSLLAACCTSCVALIMQELIFWSDQSFLSLFHFSNVFCSTQLHTSSCIWADNKQTDQHLSRAARGTTPTPRLIGPVFLLVFSCLLVVSPGEKRCSVWLAWAPKLTVRLQISRVVKAAEAPWV